MRPGTALDIVIVSYRCRDLLAVCLDSLGPAFEGPLSVIVVDNYSQDGTADLVRREHPAVRLVEMGENAGFARATNIGIRLGTAPYVLALNPDTRLEPGSLDPLVAVMERTPRAGVLGCRLVQEDGTPDHAARRSFPTALGALGQVTGLGRLPGAPAALAQYRAPAVDAGPVDAVNGAFMLMRRAALDEVGLFDEAYWMYFEDLDLCKRMHDRGWQVVYEPSVTAVHVKHGTSGPCRSPQLALAFHRGFLRFWRDHQAPARPFLVNALVAAGTWAGFALALARWVAWRALRGWRR